MKRPLPPSPETPKYPVRDDRQARARQLGFEEEAHPELTEEEPWLISYADMMTLMFGFFALMYTTTIVDEKKSDQVDKKLSQYFGGEYVQPTKLIAEKLEFMWSKLPDGGNFEIIADDDTLEIKLRSSVLFASGSADVNPLSRRIMEELARTLRSDKNRDYRVIVEGHTDDSPIQSDKFPTNWELSGARAASLVRILEEVGYPVLLLQATGFGATRPDFPNRTPAGEAIAENMARNRRVVIKVIPAALKKDAAPAAAPTGAPDAPAAEETQNADKPATEN